VWSSNSNIINNIILILMDNINSNIINNINNEEILIILLMKIFY